MLVFANENCGAAKQVCLLEQGSGRTWPVEFHGPRRMAEKWKFGPKHALVQSACVRSSNACAAICPHISTGPAIWHAPLAVFDISALVAFLSLAHITIELFLGFVALLHERAIAPVSFSVCAAPVSTGISWRWCVCAGVRQMDIIADGQDTTNPRNNTVTGVRIKQEKSRAMRVIDDHRRNK